VARGVVALGGKFRAGSSYFWAGTLGVKKKFTFHFWTMVVVWCVQTMVWNYY